MISQDLLQIDYPAYGLLILDDDSLVVAGGGGASRTGVPNKVDFLKFTRKVIVNNKDDLKPFDVQLINGISTDPDAIMVIRLSSSFMASSKICLSTLLTLQGKDLVTYSLKSNDGEYSISELNKFCLDGDTPSSMTCGQAGSSWCVALGMESGDIHVVDIDDLIKSGSSDPLITIPNITNKGACQVFSLSFSPVLNISKKKSIESTRLPPSFLSTIFDRPDGEVIRIFKLSVEIKDEICFYRYQLHDNLDVKALGIKNILKKKNILVGSRFKHCEFLSWRGPLAGFALLAVTVIPISMNSSFVSQLVIYGIEYDERKPKSPWVLAMTSLAKGQLPSCLVPHKSSESNILGLGTIDGDIYVYQFMPKTQDLVMIYHVPKAHGIFVTNLVFMPSRQHSIVDTETPLKPKKTDEPIIRCDAASLRYEIVSISADRAICWHAGPSFSEIYENKIRQSDLFSFSSMKTFYTLCNISCILFLMFSPLLIATLDRFLSFIFI